MAGLSDSVPILSVGGIAKEFLVPGCVGCAKTCAAPQDVCCISTTVPIHRTPADIKVPLTNAGMQVARRVDRYPRQG